MMYFWGQRYIINPGWYKAIPTKKPAGLYCNWTICSGHLRGWVHVYHVFQVACLSQNRNKTAKYQSTNRIQVITWHRSFYWWVHVTWSFVVCIPILAQARNLKNMVAVLALLCCLATSCTPAPDHRWFRLVYTTYTWPLLSTLSFTNLRLLCIVHLCTFYYLCSASVWPPSLPRIENLCCRLWVSRPSFCCLKVHLVARVLSVTGCPLFHVAWFILI